MKRHPDESPEAFRHRRRLAHAAALGPPVSWDYYQWITTGDPEKMPEKVREQLEDDGGERR